MLTDLDRLNRLVADLAFFCDTYQLDAMVDLWHPEGTWDLTAIGEGTWHGLSEIREEIRAGFESTHYMSHVTGTVRADIDGDAATLTTNLHYSSIHKDFRRREADGYWYINAVKVDGRWLVKFMSYNPLMPDYQNLILISDAKRKGAPIHPTAIDRPHDA